VLQVAAGTARGQTIAFSGLPAAEVLARLTWAAGISRRQRGWRRGGVRGTDLSGEGGVLGAGLWARHVAHGPIGQRLLIGGPLDIAHYIGCLLAAVGVRAR
jgi:hypothetical protein